LAPFLFLNLLLLEVLRILCALLSGLEGQQSPFTPTLFTSAVAFHSIHLSHRFVSTEQPTPTDSRFSIRILQFAVSLESSIHFSEVLPHAQGRQKLSGPVLRTSISVKNYSTIFSPISPPPRASQRVIVTTGSGL
jgi:hypothetical protein